MADKPKTKTNGESKADSKRPLEVPPLVRQS